MYAIVDIETTGSHPNANGITEIAIVLHNGTEVEGRYETLINPGYPIPPYVVQLTGITDSMVSTAPDFNKVAANIFRLLEQRIFVAHNVNFDYSFIKYHLKQAGYDWQPKKLCTLKLSRKAFPGYTKYGLGTITRTLGIQINGRHRAGGDADATAQLFVMIIEKCGEKIIREFLRKENHDQILPPNLPSEQVKILPATPGVYYFLDSKEKIVYVGKAKNIKKRVISHFSGLNISQKRQDFLRVIHGVRFKSCPTELAAAIFESMEIKRLWPTYNVSQKRYEQLYGIYSFEDNKGYHRLAIDKKRKFFDPIVSFNLMSEAHRMLWKMVKQHTLHPALCFLDRSGDDTGNYPEVNDYNIRVKEAIITLQKEQGTYAIFEPSAEGKYYNGILIENGQFVGMGLVPENINFTDIDKIKKYLTAYPENHTALHMIQQYARQNPEKVYIY